MRAEGAATARSFITVLSTLQQDLEGIRILCASRSTT
jgi:hypothetical protein